MTEFNPFNNQETEIFVTSLKSDHRRLSQLKEQARYLLATRSRQRCVNDLARELQAGLLANNPLVKDSHAWAYLLTYSMQQIRFKEVAQYIVRLVDFE